MCLSVSISIVLSRLPYWKQKETKSLDRTAGVRRRTLFFSLSLWALSCDPVRVIDRFIRPGFGSFLGHRKKSSRKKELGFFVSPPLQPRPIAIIVSLKRNSYD